MKQNPYHKQKVEEEESIEKILRSNPIFLKDTVEINKVADILLPYSTGIEIECDKRDDYDENDFKSIPDIMDVQTDSREQRYRIPSGLKGFKCLFNIYEALKENSIPNKDAGHHFHIDFTDSWKYINRRSTDYVKEYILSELDKWKYKGTYNHRESNWIKWQDYFKTLEIRVCDMSFDYSYILNKILHCQEIAKKVKLDLRLFALNNQEKHKNQNTKEKEFNAEEIIKQRKVIL